MTNYDYLNNAQLSILGTTRYYDPQSAKYIYTYTFKDHHPITYTQAHYYQMLDEDRYRFRSRQDNRTSYAIRFCQRDTDFDIQDVAITEITNSIFQISFTN